MKNSCKVSYEVENHLEYGWRGGLAAENAGCSGKGSSFGSQHPQFSLQPSVTPVPGSLMPFPASQEPDMHGIQRHAHRQNTLHTHFLIELCEFHTMHPGPTHLPVPSYLLSALVPPQIKQKKIFFRKETKQNPSCCGSCTVSQCVTQCILLSKQLSLQIVTMMSHWTCSGPLVSATLSVLDTHWDSSPISCCCPVSWRSAGLAPSLAPAVHRWGRRWGGPTQSFRSGPELASCPLSCILTTSRFYCIVQVCVGCSPKCHSL